MASEAFEERVRVLEDIEAIKALKASYCFLTDDGEVDRLAELFTADAVWDGGVIGRFEGRAAIREFFVDLPKLISFALHLVMNPRIEVHGDHATGQWYLVEPNTTAGREMAVWGAGRYDEEYVRVDGQWKFQRVVLEPVFWTPFDKGWAERRSILER